MSRLILTCFLFNIGIISYSQQEQEILSKAVQSFNNELPKLETFAFKALWIKDKRNIKLKKSEYKNYHLIIIPKYKLKDTYTQCHNSDTDIFVKYIDFTKMHKDFEVYVFKDSIFIGILNFYTQKSKHRDLLGGYFSVNDTNKYNLQSFNAYKRFAYQIKDFKPDLVFYPECFGYLCFIKEGKFYMGEEGTIQLQTSDNILPFEEFVKRYPLFINVIKTTQITEFDHEYIEPK